VAQFSLNASHVDRKGRKPEEDDEEERKQNEHLTAGAIARVHLAGSIRN
jgi:hypothetical protein